MTLEPMLTSRQKAAVIVRLLVGEGETLSLGGLPAAAQAELAQEMALMGMVDRDTRDQVVAEFCDALEQVGVTFPDGLDRTLDVLGGTLSPDITDRLRRISAMAGKSDPWARIAALPPAQIAQLAAAEATEIAAVLFSKLPAAISAASLALLPAERARQIAAAMSLTGRVEEPALRRIGMALLHATEGMARPAIGDAPVETVGAILNLTPSARREEVLDGLDQDNAEFARALRKAIFTWAQIPQRVDPRDVPRIIREIEPVTLRQALSARDGADADAAAFILGALPSRMADGLRDDIAEAGRVKDSEIEAATGEITQAIRRMEAAGDLYLIERSDTAAAAERIEVETATVA
ncbi:FliG C-terminal domain-containing protein [Paracoccus isoporae]|nr:FliG C-terminal domain-containing protein [Paracoccus isoporae]